MFSLLRWKNYLPTAKGVLGINGRNLELVYPHNDRQFFPNVDGKIRCKELLAAHDIPVPKTFHVVDGPRTLAAWPEKLSKVDDFVVKPNRGYGGNGIMLIRRNGRGFISSGMTLDTAEISFHVVQICNGAFSLDNISDTAFFEETIVNHPALKQLIGDDVEGIADVRLIVRLQQPIMAMIRIPTGESEGKANLHQGGIGIGIDLATGRTLDGCYRNRIVTTHPETGRAFRGISVPGFADMLEFSKHISQIVGLGYIGIDFACDHRSGPVALEVNARPGLNIQIANQSGLKSRLR